MSVYLVTFLKNILSSDGHQFKCLQQEIAIRRAKSIDRAVEAAERRFERIRDVPDWKLHADTLELEIDGDRVDYVPKDEMGFRRCLRFVPGMHVPRVKCAQVSGDQKERLRDAEQAALAPKMSPDVGFSRVATHHAECVEG